LEKITVITGATHGLGLAMAREFSQSGSTVVITSRKKRLAQKTCMLLSDKCQGLELDITDRSSVSKFLKSIRKTYGRVDVLINNAGFPFRRKIWFKKLHEVSDKELIDIIQVDLVGSFRLSKEIIPLMLRHRSGGVIINIASTPSVSGHIYGSPYSLAKAGVVCLTKHIALEYASQKIRAYSLVLGNIATEATYDSLSGNERVKATNENAMKRWGKPEEVAKIAVCVASDSFSYATGNNIVVDGGTIIH
jgi:3-oxoacyl-[acyl-carrier protein] reductase